VTGGMTLNDLGLTVVSGGLTVIGGASIKSNGLVVTGGMTLNDLGLTVVSGGLTVIGGASIKSNGLVVSGGMTLNDLGLTVVSGGLTVNGGASILSDGLTVTGGMTVNGNLSVSGLIYASDGLVHTSDSRLKTDIRPLDDSLSKILKLKGVYFSWIQDEKSGLKFDVDRHVGVIAQDVQSVLPEVVTDIHDGRYLGVRYSELIPLLVNAIKELDQKGTSLEDRFGLKGESTSLIKSSLLSARKLEENYLQRLMDLENSYRLLLKANEELRESNSLLKDIVMAILERLDSVESKVAMR